MEGTTVDCGLVWAVPVRPDLLGEHLQSYQQIIPTLTTLRLCHRFGRGPNVHITKLPTELVQTIEDIIFEPPASIWRNWITTFQHYEGRCEPLDHPYDDRYLDWLDAGEDSVKDQLCEMHKEDDTRWHDPCDKGCEERVRESANGLILEEVDDIYDLCEGERTAWERLIDQSPKGNFVQYDEILRKYFGLEAYFAKTRSTKQDETSWPQDARNWWNGKQGMHTTICYLTLPKQMAGEVEYPLSEMESDCGGLHIKGNRSCIVEPPTFHEAEKRARQFGKALRTLRLTPYVHPSQLKSKVSAEVSLHKTSQADSKSEGGDGAATNEKSKPQELTGTEWPKLVMLVKTRFAFDYSW